MNLFHRKERVEVYYVAYSKEEVMKALMLHQPKEINVLAWSQKYPYLYLKEYSDDGVYVSCNALFDKTFSFLTWDKFYKKFKNEISAMSFKEFKCYEIHRPNMSYNGCKKQCKECREKQNEV